MSERETDGPDAATPPPRPDAPPATRRATADGTIPQRPPAPTRSPMVETPSPDVDEARATALPGEHRGGFQRLPTEPVGLTVESAPAEPGSEDQVTAEWLMPEPPEARGLAGWALGFAIAGLLVSLFVGWGFPIGLVGIIMAIVSLRRPVESRGVAVWALVLATLSIAYSAGWLLWSASRANLFG